MDMNKKNLNLIKKVFIFVYLVFLIQLYFPHAVIAAEEVTIDFGRGPVMLVWEKSNQQIAGASDSVEIISSLPLNESLPFYTAYTTVTAYSSTPDQCDADPFTAAWGKHVYWGMVASNYFPRGTKIQIPEYFGDKIFSIEDTMNERYYNRLDIWMPDREAAQSWGVKYVEIKVFK